MNLINYKLQVEGTIEKIHFYCPENHFTAGLIKTKEKNLKFIGTLFSPKEGDQLKATGEFIINKYGNQFKIETYKTLLPKTKDGIIAYLSSSYVKGVGKKTAEKIVGVFGDNTLNLICKDYKRLTEIKGISEKKAKIIRDCLADHKEIEDLIILLKGCQLSPTIAPKIISFFKENYIEKIKKNPYQLTKIKGISFKISDKIGEKLGFQKDSIDRLEQGILFVLESITTGDMFLYSEDLLNKASELLGVSKQKIELALQNLIIKKEIVKETEFVSDPQNPAFYLRYNYVYEKGIQDIIYNRHFELKNMHSLFAEDAIKKLQEEKHIKLSEQQKRAVIFACKEKHLIISGCPGTGKSTITDFIYTIFHKNKKKVVLLAPTGRAAKRMTEIIGVEATTIHRALEFSPEQKKFTKDQDNQLEGDVFIVDEVSMVGCGLMYNFLKAVPLKANIILIGDVFQLPSVEPGNILKDFLLSECMTISILSKIFRQAKKSKIIVNSHKIKNQDTFYLPSPKEVLNEDFWFIKREEPEDILRAIKILYTRTFLKENAKECQVLTPMKKGILGTENINMELQKILNPCYQNNFLKKGDVHFGVGDKVMQLKNDYDNDIFNGDIGFIKEIDRKDEKLIINFSGVSVSLNFSALENLTLAYAITIHKSQGSEFKNVIMPITTQHFIMLVNNLIYTGITRAKKKIILVGQEKAFWIGVKNNKVTQRNSLLDKRLKSLVTF